MSVEKISSSNLVNSDPPSADIVVPFHGMVPSASERRSLTKVQRIRRWTMDPSRIIGLVEKSRKAAVINGVSSSHTGYVWPKYKFFSCKISGDYQ